MINNLCKNAIDAMPNGGVITVELETKKLDRKTKSKLSLTKDLYIKLDIKDTGYGIPKKDLNTIICMICVHVYYN